VRARGRGAGGGGGYGSEDGGRPSAAVYGWRPARGALGLEAAAPTVGRVLCSWLAAPARRLRTRPLPQLGAPPPAVAYNALLEVCVRTEDADRAMDVIDRMAEDGVDPDEMTVGIVARKRNLRAYLRKRLA
jgi:pentatricopeptide repeat protein